MSVNLLSRFCLVPQFVYVVPTACCVKNCHPERAKRTEGSDAGLQRKNLRVVHQGDPSTAVGMTEKRAGMTEKRFGMTPHSVILREQSEPKDLMQDCSVKREGQYTKEIPPLRSG